MAPFLFQTKIYQTVQGEESFAFGLVHWCVRLIEILFDLMDIPCWTSCLFLRSWFFNALKSASQVCLEVF